MTKIVNKEDMELDRINDRLDEIDLLLTLAGERDEPMPMGEEDALRAERAELQHRRLLMQREKHAIQQTGRSL